MIGRRMPYYVKRGIGGIDANTVLMLHGEDFTDVSITPKSITNHGVALNSNGKFGSCFSFNGSSSYLSLPASSAFAFGTKWTIDFWIYPKTNTEWQNIFQTHFYNAGSGVVAQMYYMRPSCLPVTGGRDFYPGEALVLNTWSHVAMVRDGANGYTFINGVIKATKRDITGSNDSTETIYIGTQSTIENWFNGKLDELRVSNIARWTANFTPPTEPYSR